MGDENPTSTVGSYDDFLQFCFTQSSIIFVYPALHTALDMTNGRPSLRAVHTAGEEEG